MKTKKVRDTPNSDGQEEKNPHVAESNSTAKNVIIAKSDSAASEHKTAKNTDSPEKPHKKLNKITIWTIKIVIITFALSAVFSYLSEITTSSAPLVVAFLLLFLLIAISIVFDAVGVAVTACDLAPLLSMASKKVKGSKMAIKLAKNADKVSNICSDVIGDICGIISGACTVAIVAKIAINLGPNNAQFWITIAFSSVVAALTVGGKAICKEIAIKNSKDLIMLVGRALSIFSKDDKK